MRHLRYLFVFYLATTVLACSGGDIAPAVDMDSQPAEDDGVVVLDPHDFELEYRFQCEPLNCETECRLGGDGDWFDCESPLVLDQDSEQLELEEGTLRFEVRALKEEHDPSSPQVIDLLVLFDYDFEVDDVDEFVPDSEESPFYFPDEYTATCERDYGEYAPDDCVLDCRWESDALDEPVDVDCPLDEPFDIEFPDETLDYAYLVVEACADHFDDDHCIGPRTYLFYPAPPEWASLTAGTGHACGIVEDGSLWCWGRNNAGQLGIGNTSTATVPSHIDDGPWQTVSAGDEHTCAIDADGALYCWGSSDHNRLGTAELDSGSFESTNEPILIHDGPWQTVSAGGEHTCALAAEGGEFDGDLVCWGAHNDGQVGSGSPEIDTGFRTVTLPFTTLDAWTDVEAADRHTCGLAVTGGGRHAAFCWGARSDGRLGDGSSSGTTHTPQEVRSPLLDADTQAISSLTEHTCAVAIHHDELRSYCWGAGGFGRLGVNSTGDRDSPDRVEGGNDLLTIAAGGDHTCAVRDDGELLCWGDNIRGQAAIDDDEALVPVIVDTPDDVGFTSVVAGNQFTCGIDVDGVSYCWGTGSSGRLGTGSDAGEESPTEIQWPQEHFIPDPSEATPPTSDTDDEDDDNDNDGDEDDE